MNEIVIWSKKLLYLVLPVFVIHFTFFQISNLKEEQNLFCYSILFLYLLFFILSQITISIAHLVSKNNFESTGFTFLGILAIKIIVYFLMLRPILNKVPESMIEKTNFIVLILIFSVVDLVLVSQILNKKE
jgi:hypothetical protein